MKKVFIVFCILFVYAYGIYRTKVFDLSSNVLLNKGTFNDVSLSENGELYLSQDVSKIIGLDIPMSWKLYSSSKDWFVGSADASIYRVDKKTKAVKKLLLSEAGGDVVAMHSLGGDLFAATSNPSALYKVSLKSEKIEKMMDLKAKYVWDMSSMGGYLYLSTGSPGKIIKVDIKKKKAEDFFNKNDENIVKLKENKGSLYAATSKAGLLYKIDPSGEYKIIYSFDDFDITDFVFGADNALYIATTGFDEKKKSMSAIFSLKGNKMEAVYKVDETLSALSLQGEHLFFSTFNKKQASFYGYSLREHKTELLLDLNQKKSSFVTNIIDEGKRSVFLTSSGDIYEHKDLLSTKGEYISDILDANSIAIWGKIIYSSDDPKSFKIYTQGAMNPLQEDGFEKWKEVKDDGSINSEPSRYLRLKIIFEKKADSKKTLKRLWGLKVYYASDESQIKIKDFSMTRDEKWFQKLHIDYSYEGSLLFWNIQNDSNSSDGEMSYKIFFKEKNEKDWREFTKSLSKPSYVFNRFFLPEAQYDFKVVAFDGTENAVDHFEIRNISIDNTPPRIKYLYEQSNLISFQAIDEGGNIKKLGYSFERSPERFYDATPVDKVFDSPIETFIISRTKAGAKKLYLYVEDESGNFSYQIISLDR